MKTFSEMFAERQARPTLGAILTPWRQETGLTVRELAIRLGVSATTARGFEDDTVLPTAQQVFPLCDALGELPHRLLRHVQATARVILTRALEAPPPASLDLPVPLQAAIARGGQTGVAEALSQARTRPPCERDLWVAAIVADLELEGEDELAHLEPDEPLPEDLDEWLAQAIAADHRPH